MPPTSETLIHGAGLLLLISGTVFFTAGTVGLIRFPDVRSRLHALAKADTLGLGLVLLGAGLLLGSWSAAVVLLLTWLLALGAASTSAHVLARLEAEKSDGTEPR
ncbi:MULTISPECIES: cation:proton antiporter [Nesterenkonia]|uniref:Multicomponent Na+:H+ antiporter subunit G n=1 Tax=Nesterenkonia xinjiangensis TaxID=225327 RepID=A0A7Z0GLD8_9MICC|nr:MULTISPECIES: monovalent cation/H(+) antiporter subunit G [Nesterenkonia]MDZ5077422.1 monovalent cation/H(+) antiporter subunit G [Nesterenkonia sp. HG001]NYJ78055.1 multicomponent Na+:H+ antiporter subunit G [Nesterenkonia xinjiangensis]